jgi:hypothetical protein
VLEKVRWGVVDDVDLDQMGKRVYYRMLDRAGVSRALGQLEIERHVPRRTARRS